MGMYSGDLSYEDFLEMGYTSATSEIGSEQIISKGKVIGPYNGSSSLEEITEEIIEGVDERILSQPLEEKRFIIPNGKFLLNSPSGDIFLQPDGLSEKDEFLVLFFPSEANLVFKPTIGAKFIGAFNLSSGSQSVYFLYYSGINFQLPDSERMAIIFHKMSVDVHEEI